MCPELPEGMAALMYHHGRCCADDFTTMTNFMSTAVNSIAATHPDAKVCCDKDATYAIRDVPAECFPRPSL